MVEATQIREPQRANGSSSVITKLEQTQSLLLNNAPIAGLSTQERHDWAETF